jgi:PPOX class probable F420-dependent enzyme
MRHMTPEEIRSFLTAGTRTAMLATVRADGRPHLVPVWFVLDGDDIVFNTGGTTIKAANLRRDPRVALAVDDATPPFAYVRIEGTATISEEPAALRHWAEAIGGRYMGAEQAAAFGARNGVPGEWLVRVRPTRIVGEAGIADWE